MAREVTHEAHGPRIVDEEEFFEQEKGDIAICMCGLSGDYPFCDGTHRETADEDDDVRYKYERDEAGNLTRRAVTVVDAEE